MKGDNAVKIIMNEINNTGDLAKALSELPSDTVLYPFGSMMCKLVYDEENKQAYIDEDLSFMDDDDDDLED